MQKIRLSTDDIHCICEAFRTHFLPKDSLWIFGSRVNEQARGGDIDLYVETDYPSAAQVVDAKINFLVDLKGRIGDQKIDVVIKFGNTLELPIYRLAKREGIQLV